MGTPSGPGPVLLRPVRGQEGPGPPPSTGRRRPWSPHLLDVARGVTGRTQGLEPGLRRGRVRGGAGVRRRRIHEDDVAPGRVRGPGPAGLGRPRRIAEQGRVAGDLQGRVLLPPVSSLVLGRGRRAPGQPCRAGTGTTRPTGRGQRSGCREGPADPRPPRRRPPAQPAVPVEGLVLPRPRRCAVRGGPQTTVTVVLGRVDRVRLVVLRTAQTGFPQPPSGPDPGRRDQAVVGRSV